MDKNGRPLVKFLNLVVILLAVILLVVLLAVIPAVIQHYINSVDLTINYLDVKGVPSDSTLTVELSLNVQHDIAISTSTEDITASHDHTDDEGEFVDESTSAVAAMPAQGEAIRKRW
ncbi:hypothetical protein PR003_g5457 [Phytophthora rubi]|uniref:Uncharacterized protein n=1 Tax=Phytophthora rubi TaxID=129364 RepID=A0A6A4FJG2_9STRA|nr:hypothetical protein PR003_g5457 [Phytophthora rubi]